MERLEEKIDTLLSKFRFGTVEDVLVERELLKEHSIQRSNGATQLG